MLLTKRNNVIDVLDISNYNEIIKKYVDDKFIALSSNNKRIVYELIESRESMPITYFRKYIIQNIFKSNTTMVSIDFWLCRGYTPEESKRIVSIEQRKRSPICKEYWIKRGYTEVEAEEKVSEVQKYNSNLSNNVDIEELRKRSPRCKEYWIKRGYTEVDAEEKVSEFQDQGSLKYFIEKYGTECGTRKYENVISKKRRFGVDNGQFGKAAPIGSGRGISGYYKNYYFRSLYEYKIIKTMINNNIVFRCNEKSSPQKIIIPYMYNGNKRNYIPDFVIIYNNEKYVLEVKNSYSVSTDQTKTKLNALREYINMRDDYAGVVVIHDVKIDNNELKRDYLDKNLIIDSGKLDRFLKRIRNTK